MLSAEKAMSYSREEKIELMKWLISKKIEKILDKEIILSVLKFQKKVSLVIDCGCDFDSELLKGYLEIYWYEKVDVKFERCEDSSRVSVKFEIPEEVKSQDDLI